MSYDKILAYLLVFICHTQIHAKDFLETSAVVSQTKFVVSISADQLNKIELQNAKLKHNFGSHAIVQAVGEFYVPIAGFNISNFNVVGVSIDNHSETSCFKFSVENPDTTNSVCLWFEEDSYRIDSNFLKVHASVAMFQNFSSPLVLEDFQNMFKIIMQRAAMIPGSSDKRLDLNLRAILELK